jgi:pimeloyl-ACP methyl ester carboxylesterase
MITSPDNSSLYRSAEGCRQVMEHYDATLRAMAVPCVARYAETRYGSTHVIIGGNEQGKPVVLWHGQNANATSWVHWIPALAPTYRIYAVDVIGGMGKSAPSRPSKKGLAYGQWAAEVIERLGLKQANMIGASQGGWLIGKLGNVAPDVPPDPFLLELFELMMRYFRSEAIVPAISDEEIRRLQAPTYLLMGQHESAMNPCQVLERGLRLLPNVVIAEIVPGVGHSMIHRQPDWVISRIVNFLDKYAT